MQKVEYWSLEDMERNIKASDEGKIDITPDSKLCFLRLRDSPVFKHHMVFLFLWDEYS